MYTILIHHVVVGREILHVFVPEMCSYIINMFFYQYGCIVSTCADGTVKMWSHKGVEITTLYGHTQRATGCDIAVSLIEDGSTGKISHAPLEILF